MKRPIDIYVDEPLVVFDERVEDRLLAVGLSIGRSESGGLYVDAGKPVEIVYPIHDVFVPRTLRKHVVIVEGMRVLEGHAALVAKALGSNIEHLAGIIRSRGVSIDTGRLRELLESVSGEVDYATYRIVWRRIERFLVRYRGTSLSSGIWEEVV